MNEGEGNDHLSHRLDAIVEAATEDPETRALIAKTLMQASAIALTELIDDDMTIAGARNLLAKFVMILLGTASQMDLAKAMECRTMLQDDYKAAGDFVDRFVANEYTRLMALTETGDV